MFTRTPMPRRWSERAEAERVCTLAVVECEAQRSAVRRIEVTAASRKPRPSFWLWRHSLIRWLRSAGKARRRPRNGVILKLL
jgi:hypothetical protein